MGGFFGCSELVEKVKWLCMSKKAIKVIKNLVSKLKLVDKKLLIGGVVIFVILSGSASYAIFMNQKTKKTEPETSKTNSEETEGEEKTKEEQASETDKDTQPDTGTGSASNGSNTGTAPPEAPSDPGSPGWVWDETPPVFVNLMVNFAPYNPGTGKAGDFIFDAVLDKVFGDFGQTVSSPEGPKILPTYDFMVTLDTPVYAPTGGEVVMLTYQASTNDYEILIRPVYNSVWLINYDHLRNLNPAIAEGAQITAGQYLGTPGPWFSNGIVELMITRDIGEGSIAYCPYDFLSSSLKATYTSKINTIMSEWETFKGDSSIYDEGVMVKPGCLMNTTS